MPGTYNFPTHYKGDTFKSMVFKFVKNGTNIDLTGYTFLIQFRPGGRYRTPSIEWTLNSGVKVLDPLSGELIIESQLIDIDAGVYDYDIQMTKDGVTDTYIEGKIEVKQDVSR
jgi:hypothetical protein